MSCYKIPKNSFSKCSYLINLFFLQQPLISPLILCFLLLETRRNRESHASLLPRSDKNVFYVFLPKKFVFLPRRMSVKCPFKYPRRVPKNRLKMDLGRVAVQLRGLLSGLRPGQGRFCLLLDDPGRVTILAGYRFLSKLPRAISHSSDV